MSHTSHVKPKLRNPKLVYTVATIAALAGLLFGIDIGVISGALGFIKQDFHLSNFEQEMVVSSILAGAVIGTIISGRISHYWGRRMAILISAIIFTLGSIFSAFAPSIHSLIAIRFLLGTAIGIASFTAPLYLSEISPKRIRGALVSMYQLMITIGIFLAFTSDALLHSTGSWRLMLGVTAIPAFIMFIGVLFLPRSPRWLMLAGRKDLALKILHRIHGDSEEVATEIKEIEDNLAHSVSGVKVFKLSYFRHVLFLGITLQFFQIMTGMNVLMYYAPKIYAMAGFVGATAVWANVINGLVNVLTTILAILAIDRWGRRPLLFFGLTLQIIGMATLALIFGHGATTDLLRYTTMAGMLVFIVGFAASLGPVIWVICAEIFPLKSRDTGVTFTTATNWICNAFIGGTFLTAIAWIGTSNTFWTLAAIAVAAMLFIYFFTPETKNISLERLEKHLMSGERLRDLGR
ncbi:MAG: sugar porter family MFS transporter [Gammaproteobacteria bacterium]|nr:sugar porter family MFS transporter [Gammaproteobacteria bacterium]